MKANVDSAKNNQVLTPEPQFFLPLEKGFPQNKHASVTPTRKICFSSLLPIETDSYQQHLLIPLLLSVIAHYGILNWPENEPNLSLSLSDLNQVSIIFVDRIKTKASITKEEKTSFSKETEPVKKIVADVKNKPDKLNIVSKVVQEKFETKKTSNVSKTSQVSAISPAPVRSIIAKQSELSDQKKQPDKLIQSRERKQIIEKKTISSPTPEIIMNPKFREPPQPPNYPHQAIRRGQEGTVLIRAMLSTTGKVEELSVYKSSGLSMLDKAALTAVNKWAFEPSTKNGIPTISWVQVPVNFRLNN